MKQYVAFGEILLRLSSPDRQLLLQTPRLDVWIGGAEANVATALAALGHPTRLISAVPEGPLGDAALAAVRAGGVDTATVRRSDGRMGLYWVESGAGLRPTKVTYDRSDSAFVKVLPKDWRFADVLDGASFLHLSGITPALCAAGTEVALAAADAAIERDIPIVFDGNYRALLWNGWESNPKATLNLLVGQTQILFGNHLDIGLLLNDHFDGASSAGRRAAAEAAFATFPRLELIASTARTIDRSDCHRMTARVDTRTEAAETDEIIIEGIVERIGTGDAFAAGVLHGVLTGHDLEQIARMGLAMSALKHSTPGDAAPFSSTTLEDFAFGSLDVRR